MKISEVPQDAIKTMAGEKKALYAVDHQGEYARTVTRGWEAEEIVLTQVIEDFEVKAKLAADRVRRGETSPIEYFKPVQYLFMLMNITTCKRKKSKITHFC